jgi:hypothetical protein
VEIALLLGLAVLVVVMGLKMMGSKTQSNVQQVSKGLTQAGASSSPTPSAGPPSATPAPTATVTPTPTPKPTVTPQPVPVVTATTACFKQTSGGCAATPTAQTCSVPTPGVYICSLSVHFTVQTALATDTQIPYSVLYKDRTRCGGNVLEYTGLIQLNATLKAGATSTTVGQDIQLPYNPNHFGVAAASTSYAVITPTQSAGAPAATAYFYGTC